MCVCACVCSHIGNTFASTCSPAEWWDDDLLSARVWNVCECMGFLNILFALQHKLDAQCVPLNAIWMLLSWVVLLDVPSPVTAWNDWDLCAVAIMIFYLCVCVVFAWSSQAVSAFSPVERVLSAGTHMHSCMFSSAQTQHGQTWQTGRRVSGCTCGCTARRCAEIQTCIFTNVPRTQSHSSLSFSFCILFPSHARTHTTSAHSAQSPMVLGFNARLSVGGGSARRHAKMSPPH